MFPFSYHKTLVIEKPADLAIDATMLLNKLQEEFDESKLINRHKLSFGGSNFSFKRRALPDSGELKLEIKNNTIVANVHLDFYLIPIVLIFISLPLIINNIDNPSYAIISTGMFWGFYSVLYVCISSIYVISVRRSIRRQIFIRKTEIPEDQLIVEVKDACPACGNKVTPIDNECPDCGLVFNNV